MLRLSYQFNQSVCLGIKKEMSHVETNVYGTLWAPLEHNTIELFTEKNDDSYPPPRMKLQRLLRSSLLFRVIRYFSFHYFWCIENTEEWIGRKHIWPEGITIVCLKLGNSRLKDVYRLPRFPSAKEVNEFHYEFQIWKWDFGRNRASMKFDQEPCLSANNAQYSFHVGKQIVFVPSYMIFSPSASK